MTDVHGDMGFPRTPSLHSPQHPSPRSPVTQQQARGPRAAQRVYYGGDIQNSHASPGHRAPRHSQGLAHKRGRGASAGAVPVPQQDPSPRSCPAAGSIPSRTEGDGRDSQNGSFFPLVHHVYKYRSCVYPSYVYMYIGGPCPSAGPSLEPRVAVEGAGLGVAPGRGAGVEHGHAAAAGAHHVRHKARTVRADVAQHRALGVDVREFLLHPAPARPRERAAAQGTPSAPRGGGGGRDRGGRLRTHWKGSLRRSGGALDSSEPGGLSKPSA